MIYWHYLRGAVMREGKKSKSMVVAGSLLLAAFFLIARPFSGAAAAANPPSGRLVVIGVQSEVSRPEWDDQLIGYGLAQLLLQQLYDTGLYTPIEDNPEILAEIEKLIVRQWRGEANGYTPSEADALAEKFGSDVTAAAKIKKVATERSRGSIGPFSSAETEITVEIEVTVKKKGEEAVRASGEGRSSTKSKSMMFKVRDNKLHLDETAVGKAADKALKKAVEGLNI